MLRKVRVLGVIAVLGLCGCAGLGQGRAAPEYVPSDEGTILVEEPTATQEATDLASVDALDEIAAAEQSAEAERVAAEELAQASKSQFKSETWLYQNDAGYSYTLRVSAGTAMPASQLVSHPYDTDFTAGSACDLDPNKDVVIPVLMEATATTSGFETVISAGFVLNSGRAEYSGSGVPPSKSDGRVSVEQDFTDEVDCKDMSSTNAWGYGQPDAVAVKWTDPVPEGKTVSSEAFVIIHDYYLPAHPDGDAALLDYIQVTPISRSADSPSEAFIVERPESGMLSGKRLSLAGVTIES